MEAEQETIHEWDRCIQERSEMPLIGVITAVGNRRKLWPGVFECPAAQRTQLGTNNNSC